MYAGSKKPSENPFSRVFFSCSQARDLLDGHDPEGVAAPGELVVRVPQAPSGGAFEGEGCERHPCLLPEFEERHAQVRIQIERLGVDLVEGGLAVIAVAQLDKLPGEVLPLLLRPDRIAHRDPSGTGERFFAPTRDAVHEEDVPAVAQEELLVAEQGEVRIGPGRSPDDLVDLG
jgi:hypothetical protein